MSPVHARLQQGLVPAAPAEVHSRRKFHETYPTHDRPSTDITPQSCYFVGLSPQSNSGVGVVGHREPEHVEFAVERGAADVQPARHFRHLVAIARQGEFDRLRLDLFEGARMTEI